MVLLGLAFAVGGVILIFWGARMAEGKAEAGAASVVVSEVIKSLGGTLFATATLALAWELIAGRAFTQEVLTQIRMSSELAEAGIQRVVLEYLEETDWDAQFDNTTRMDLFVSYAQTWKNANHSGIQRLAARKGVVIRVAHPNPDDERSGQAVQHHPQEAV